MDLSHQDEARHGHGDRGGAVKRLTVAFWTIVYIVSNRLAFICERWACKAYLHCIKTRIGEES